MTTRNHILTYFITSAMTLALITTLLVSTPSQTFADDAVIFAPSQQPGSLFPLTINNNGDIIYGEQTGEELAIKVRAADGTMTSFSVPPNDENLYPGQTNIRRLFSSSDGSIVCLIRNSTNSGTNFNLLMCDLGTNVWIDRTENAKTAGVGAAVAGFVSNTGCLFLADAQGPQNLVVLGLDGSFVEQPKDFSFDGGDYRLRVHLGILDDRYYFTAYNTADYIAHVFSIGLSDNLQINDNWVAASNPNGSNLGFGFSENGQLRFQVVNGQNPRIIDIMSVDSTGTVEFLFSYSTYNYSQETDPVESGMIVFANLKFNDLGEAAGFVVLYTGDGQESTDLGPWWVWNIRSGLAYFGTPEELLEDLILAVAVINLDNGISNQLDTKLDAAIDAFLAENADQRNDAVNKLNGFINSVEAQRGKKISDAEADTLVAAAEGIIVLIE